MSDNNGNSNGSSGNSGNDGNSGGGNRKAGSNSRKGNQQNQNGSNGQANGKRRKNRKKPRLDPVKYWGDAATLPVRSDYALESSDPTAVIRSLGRAPIPGKNSAPELYFEVLYSRAAGLAQALSFAGGLNQDDDGDDTTD